MLPSSQTAHRGAALRVTAARKTYGSGSGTAVALDGVDLVCPPGTLTAVMGPSGSGKSTLLQCAAGLDRLDEGRVEIAGRDITRANDTQLTQLRRDTVGFVFQAYNLIASLSVHANVALPLKLSGRRPDKGLVRSTLADLGLGNLGTRRPRELSGGQQQRVAIARALVTAPEILFADEPTGALDSSSAEQVLALLRDMVDRTGQTVLMVTHDPTAAAHADRVVLLSDGRVVDHLDRPTAREIADHLTALGG